MTTKHTSRREATRAPGHRTGLIKLGLFKRINCNVSDISNRGAKLETSDADSLPKKFTIAISGSGKQRKHKCAKRWQDGDNVGVEFLYS